MRTYQMGEPYLKGSYMSACILTLSLTDITSCLYFPIIASIAEKKSVLGQFLDNVMNLLLFVNPPGGHLST